MSSVLSGRHQRRIQAFSTDGTGFLGPGELALNEWATLGLQLPDLPQMRRDRLERLRAELRRCDYAGILLTDPLNIRYATDSSNMQLWTAHNLVRYAFIATDGPVILFDFHNCEHLCEHLELIDEIRPAIGTYFMGAGERFAELATRQATEIHDLVRQHGGGNSRLAVDKLSIEALDTLRGLGLSVHNGEAVMELARVIKTPEEIRAMRCALAATETAMAAMHRALEPGITEQRLWSVLHAENIARGGEWIETRLLSSGPRANPWFRECSSRVIQDGELVAFDTDLVGPYGFCADISRTWFCGDGHPDGEQQTHMALAREQIAHNLSLLRPGVSFAELTHTARLLPEEYLPNHYSVLFHGVGLCDEYPSIYYPDGWEASGYDGVVEAGMVFCVESYVGRVGGRVGVKLEEQVLITDTGAEQLSSYPLEC